MKRIDWLDQIKGWAVGVGFLLYFLPLVLKVNTQGELSSALDLIKTFKFYIPMGLVLISGISIYYTPKVDKSWWVRKFLALVVLSSWFYLIGQDESHYYTMMISVLFFYYPLWWFLKSKAGVEKILVNLVLGLIYFIGLKLSPETVPLPVGGASLSEAGAWQLFGLNLLSGIPMVILGSFLIPWVLSGGLNLRRLNQAVLILGGIFLIDLIAYHYFLTTPITSGFPPMLRQTWVGAAVVLGGISLSNYLPRALQRGLAALGHRSLLHYWSLWLGATLVVSWNKFGLHQFSPIQGLGLGFLIIFGYGILLSIKPQAGIVKQE